MTSPLPGLRRIRENRGLSRRQLMNASGIHENTIRFIETGRYVSTTTHTAGKLAQALEVSIVDLIAESAVEQMQRRTKGMMEFLQDYRAVPYHGGGGKKKEAHCGDSAG